MAGLVLVMEMNRNQLVALYTIERAANELDRNK